MYVLFLENQLKFTNYLSRVLTAEAISHFNIGSYDELETYILTKDHPEPDVVVLDQDYEFKVVTRYLPIIKKEWGSKVLVLAENLGAKERVRILNLGADDCMSQPIDLEELIVRIKKLYARNENKPTVSPNLSNLFYVDSDLKKITINNKSLNLTQKEYILAETFLNHPNRVFSKVILLDIGWGIQAEVESNVVEVTINSLRRKIEAQSDKICIKSRRNLGYWLELPVP